MEFKTSDGTVFYLRVVTDKQVGALTPVKLFSIVLEDNLKLSWKCFNRNNVMEVIKSLLTRLGLAKASGATNFAPFGAFNKKCQEEWNTCEKIMSFSLPVVPAPTAVKLVSRQGHPLTFVYEGLSYKLPDPIQLAFKRRGLLNVDQFMKCVFSEHCNDGAAIPRGLIEASFTEFASQAFPGASGLVDCFLDQLHQSQQLTGQSWSKGRSYALAKQEETSLSTSVQVSTISPAIGNSLKSPAPLPIDDITHSRDGEYLCPDGAVFKLPVLSRGRLELLAPRRFLDMLVSQNMHLDWACFNLINISLIIRHVVALHQLEDSTSAPLARQFDHHDALFKKDWRFIEKRLDFSLPAMPASKALGILHTNGVESFVHSNRRYTVPRVDLRVIAQSGLKVPKFVTMFMKENKITKGAADEDLVRTAVREFARRSFPEASHLERSFIDRFDRLYKRNNVGGWVS